MVCLTAMALAGITAPAASAAPEREGIPASLTEQQSTQHFQVHYTSSDPEHAVPAHAVPGILAIAEEAYARLVGGAAGFEPPLDDGDGRVDIYVRRLEEDLAITRGDRPTPERPNRGSAYIELDPAPAVAQGPSGDLRYILPHELFHVIQFAYSGREALWLAEATAEWAARSLAGADFYARPEENWFQNPNQPLDCFEDSCGGSPSEERATQGYNRWPFFRFLEERFGASVVRDVWAHSRVLSADGRPHALEAVEAALRPRGTTLGRAFADFVVAAGSGNWQHEGLRRLRPAPAGALRTGRFAGARSLRAQLAHLTGAYLQLTGGGDQETLSVCLPARLSLQVSHPADQAGSPALITPDGAASELRGYGSLSSLDRRWHTCQASAATLALANTSWNVDGVPFDLGFRVVPRRRLRLPRDKPVVDFYLELPRWRSVRLTMSLPPDRRRPRRTITRRMRVPPGAEPLRVRLPRSASSGRYRLTARFRTEGGSFKKTSRGFRVRIR